MDPQSEGLHEPADRVEEPGAGHDEGSASSNHRRLTLRNPGPKSNSVEKLRVDANQAIEKRDVVSVRCVDATLDLTELAGVRREDLMAGTTQGPRHPTSESIASRPMRIAGFPVEMQLRRRIVDDICRSLHLLARYIDGRHHARPV